MAAFLSFFIAFLIGGPMHADASNAGAHHTAAVVRPFDSVGIMPGG